MYTYLNMKEVNSIINETIKKWQSIKYIDFFCPERQLQINEILKTECLDHCIWCNAILSEKGTGSETKGRPVMSFGCRLFGNWWIDSMMNWFKEPLFVWTKLYYTKDSRSDVRSNCKIREKKPWLCQNLHM